VLYALRHPVALAALAVGFVLAAAVHVVARAALARATGQLAALPEGRRPFDLRQQLDPFGVVALLLAGVGWVHPLRTPGRWRARRGRRIGLALSGSLANLVVGCAGFIGYRAMAGGQLASLAANVELKAQLQGSLVAVTTAEQFLLALALANLATGVLALVPIPPLEGSDVLFTLAPPNHGWQRARYYLAEQNWGVALVGLLLLLPIAGNEPPLLSLLGSLLRPLLAALANL